MNNNVTEYAVLTEMYVHIHILKNCNLCFVAALWKPKH